MSATFSNNGSKNGARILLDALIKHNVDTVFGYPGGANLTLYDEIHKQSDIKHYLFCHEQAATHAAEGYARATGKLGVVFLTSGPGATNGVTGITDAMLDSTPMLIITSQVPSHLLGSDAFQEADILGITKSITKHNYLVKDAKKVWKTVNEAIHIAMSGRKGPVLVDIPKDIHAALLENPVYDEHKVRDSYAVKSEVSKTELAPVLELLLSSKKPIFYCGGGVNACEDISKVTNDLKQLIEITGTPITTTLMGLGVFDANHKQSLHMLGMHGSYEANMAMYEADLIIALGVRFDDRVTGNLKKFAPNSKKVHIDIDPSELNKNVKVDVAIKGCVSSAISNLLEMVKESKSKLPSFEAFWGDIHSWRQKDSFGFKQSGGTILPQYALSRLHELSKASKPFFTTDVGQHQMWAAQYCKVANPRQFITSAGLGTMGYGLPAAIGAIIGESKSPVICITGEGSFMMNVQELSTLKRYGMPVKIFMLQNNYLGMVRQWQDAFYENRHTEVDFTQIVPDFIKLFGAFDLTAEVVSDPSDLDGAISRMLESDKPHFLSVITKRDEDVYPMIAPGKGHNEMILSK